MSERVFSIEHFIRDGMDVSVVIKTGADSDTHACCAAEIIQHEHLGNSLPLFNGSWWAWLHTNGANIWLAYEPSAPASGFPLETYVERCKQILADALDRTHDIATILAAKEN